MTAPLSPEHALIYTLIATAAADRKISDDELATITSIVHDLPPFEKLQGDWLLDAAQNCGKLLSKPGGVDIVLAQVKAALPKHLRETAYVLAAEVAETDLTIAADERHMLALIAKSLELDPLTCAALDRAAKARHATV